MSKYRAGFTPEVVCVVNQLDKCDYEFASGSPDLLRQLERVLLDLRSWGETRAGAVLERGTFARSRGAAPCFVVHHNYWRDSATAAGVVSNDT